MGQNERNRQFENQPSTSGLETDPGRRPRELLLGRLIVGQTIAVSFLTVMTATGGLLMPGSDLLALMPLGVIAVIVGLVSYWLLRRRKFELASYLFLIGTSVAITSNVYVRGYQDESGIYYLWPILGAVALLETRGGIVVLVFSAGSYLALVILQQLGYLTPPLPYDPQGQMFLTVGSRVLMFFLLAFLGWLSSQNLRRALQQANQAAQGWRELNETLEQRVADRTRDLDRRARYLEAIAEVAKGASSLLNLQELLSQVVELISTQFGFYHTGIFLLDPPREWAVLQAASSEGGQRMQARGHRLRVGHEGIVGQVTYRGVPRVALDVGADATFFNNPDLPETRSEAALPLQARGELIGALDVQSQEPAAFSEEDVAALQTLADQVAVAIGNAKLFQQVQESLEAERRTYGELSRQAWKELVRVRSNLGFVSDQRGIALAGDLWEPQMNKAMQTGEIAPGDGDETALAIPIKVRGNVIGVVDAHKPDSASEWTADEIALIETLTEQLGEVLESVRLNQDTQRRAAQERLAGEVTTRMRESLDMETVLKTALDEMYRALGLDEIVIRQTTERSAN